MGVIENDDLPQRVIIVRGKLLVMLDSIFQDAERGKMLGRWSFILGADISELFIEFRYCN